mmetsp:Transcript_34456/g.90669  ORF Transcript_34456/g.90669 Transcript_34456/m.90669 type:complete len:378 (+) Transcript_34456:14-1147(+)
MPPRMRLHDEDEQEATIAAMALTAMQRQRNVKGMLSLLTSMLIVPFMDACAKALVMHQHHVLQVTWLRMIMQCSVVVPIAIWNHGIASIAKPSKPFSLLLRGIFLLCASICFFASIEYLPLADAVAITFIEPAILLLMSAILLRERVGIRNWLAVATGFGAVLLIVKPGTSSFQPASLLALGCACFFSLYLYATKLLLLDKAMAPPKLIMLAYQCVPGAIILAMPVLTSLWTPLRTLWELVFGLAMGVIGACSHFLLILAFDCSNASYLSPMLYMEIIMQTLLGAWFWGDFPDVAAWLGIALLIAVGIYLSRISSEEGSAPASASCPTTQTKIEASAVACNGGLPVALLAARSCTNKADAELVSVPSVVRSDLDSRC